MFKIRWSRDRLIFNMGIPILGKDSLYIKMPTWSSHCCHHLSLGHHSRMGTIDDVDVDSRILGFWFMTGFLVMSTCRYQWGIIDLVATTGRKPTGLYHGAPTSFRFSSRLLFFFIHNICSKACSKASSTTPKCAPTQRKWVHTQRCGEYYHQGNHLAQTCHAEGLVCTLLTSKTQHCDMYLI